MRADNSAFIVEAAHQRHEATARRAREALRRLDRAGADISFQTVAEAASVSRAWLYREPTLRAEIERLRCERRLPRAPVVPPAAQRATDESLQRRLEAAAVELTRLKDENRLLREQVARLHGERRATNARSPSLR